MLTTCPVASVTTTGGAGVSDGAAGPTRPQSTVTRLATNTSTTKLNVIRDPRAGIPIESQSMTDRRVTAGESDAAAKIGCHKGHTTDEVVISAGVSRGYGNWTDGALRRGPRWSRNI